MNRRTIVRLSLLPLLALLTLLTACGGSGGNGGGSSTGSAPAQADRVTLTDSMIQSSMTTFTVGVPYTFVVTNKGHSPHDFLIRTKVGSGSGPLESSGILFYSNRSVPPGITENFSFEFPLSSLQSHLQLATQLAEPNGHAITTPIQVQQRA